MKASGVNSMLPHYIATSVLSCIVFEKGLFLNEENKAGRDRVWSWNFKLIRGNTIKIMTCGERERC